MKSTLSVSSDHDPIICTLREGDSEAIRVWPWTTKGLLVEAVVDNEQYSAIDLDPELVLVGRDRVVSTDLWCSTDYVSHSLFYFVRNTVPRELYDVVGRFTYGQYQFLHGLGMCPELMEIAMAAPVFCFLIIERLMVRLDLLQRKGAALARARWRTILEEIGLTGSGSAVKLLGKIPRQAKFSHNGILALKEVLRSEQKIALLAHFPVIDEARLRCAAEGPEELFAYTFFRNELMGEELDFDQINMGVIRVYKDIRAMAEMVGLDLSDSLRNCKTKGQLWRLHDRLAARLGQKDFDEMPWIRDLRKIYGDNFPPPPLPTLPQFSQIEPLTDIYALVREAADQENCVLCYAGDIYCGDCYLYKILPGKGINRCTMEITLEGGIPCLGQVQLKGNRGAPSARTMDYVREWMRVTTV